MTPATLRDLPPPPPDRSGWPWTEESTPLPARMPGGDPWPRLSVVTPSFNQGRFIEATLRSVLLQGYPNLEYVVMDGGSSDGSVATIEKYARWLTYWVSKPDGGQSAAIDAGLRRCSGLYATWINSDDMLARNALGTHAAQIGFHPNAVYVGDCLYVDVEGRPVGTHRARVHSLEDLLRIGAVWRAREPRGHIVQPEVLFPRQLALDVGGLDSDNHRTMDYDLWGRLFLASATFEYTRIPFGVFRLHAEQKIRDTWRQTQSLIATALALAARADRLPHDTREALIADLRAYERQYWLRSSWLARMGLPPQLVLALRDCRLALGRRAAQLVGWVS